MIACRFVILVVRVLQGDEVAGVEKDLRVNHRGGSFAVQVAVVILGAIARPGLHGVLPKSRYWVVGGQHEEPARFFADLDLFSRHAFEHLPGDENSFFGDLRFHLYSLVSPGDAVYAARSIIILQPNRRDKEGRTAEAARPES